MTGPTLTMAGQCIHAHILIHTRAHTRTGPNMKRNAHRHMYIVFVLYIHAHTNIHTCM